MLRRLGYVAISLSITATTNRTCRLGNATPEHLRALTAANLAGLAEVLAFNAAHEVGLYRISSQLVPFASHPVNTVPWWEEFRGELLALGDYIRAHRMRVSMHPGQFTVLSTPDPAARTASLRELEYHMRVMDGLGVDASHKVIVHLGGAYGDKGAARRRFGEVVNDLPESWRRRLVVENDERTYDVEDVLSTSAETGVPVVFDSLHHRLNPGGLADPAEAMALASATWRRDRDGLPKVHFSSQQPGGRPGAHADWVNADEFLAFVGRACDITFDCMLEAKKKDLALFRLRAALEERGLAFAEAS